ncbi:MAG: protein arginine kinase [Ruminococcus sp.]|uniref:protein arginine kinase n=1 Tax=Ruminococcus sp. TaxID=41978 RepID=UPI0028738D40|nr:protein arginine kinase [Ruminococcus sp.]MBQ3284355.1 protein arginine kinase [Ruminococcus sp.]
MSEAVVSTRIRLARNLKEYPFPIRLSSDKAREIVDKVGEALKDSELKFHRIDMDAIPDTIRVAMIERHLVSPDFISEQEGRAVYLSDDNTVSIMVNEEDHIRLQVMMDGFQPEEAYALADKVDNILSKKLNFAFHDRLGYLTQCPTNLGTGMRASVMLHLPALEMSGTVNRIGANLSKLGLTMRGLYGESSKPAGAFFQLSNQVTLGISEKAAIENLKNITNQLITQEMRARESLLNNIEAEDKINRALGVLKTARLMDHNEAMKLLSLVRLGVSEKKIETLSTDSIDKLIVEIQPASIMTRYGDDMSPRDRDIKRAQILRERFA